MIMNIIGIGSVMYLIGSYLGCSPRIKTKINPECLSIGGCPYIQINKDPSSLKLSVA